MLGAAVRQRLRPWRFEKREDQRVLGAVSAGADVARGPLHRCGLSNGLNATLCHAMPEKCIWRDFESCSALRSSMGRRQFRSPQLQGWEVVRAAALSVARMQAGVSKQSGNRVVLNTAFRVFFLVCSNPDLFNNPVAKSAGNRAS